MDISHFTEVLNQASCHPVTKYVETGFAFKTLMISNAISAAVAAGLAWYARGRGTQGIKNDMANAQIELLALKSKISDQVSAKTS